MSNLPQPPFTATLYGTPLAAAQAEATALRHERDVPLASLQVAAAMLSALNDRQPFAAGSAQELGQMRAAVAASRGEPAPEPEPAWLFHRCGERITHRPHPRDCYYCNLASTNAAKRAAAARLEG